MEEIYDGDIYTLTDETGKESEFELIGSCEFEGKTYLALVPVEEDSEEYVILRLELDETGEETRTERIERAHTHILKAELQNLFPA